MPTAPLASSLSASNSIFASMLSGSPPPLPEFTVRKGQSLWEAFGTFTRRVYGVEPNVSGNVVYVSGFASHEPLVLGGAKHPLSNLEEVVSHYEPVSKVVLRGEDGSYVTAVNNPDVQGLDISRARYLIPATEFAAKPVLDAQQCIRRSMGRMRKVIATVPGYLNAGVGQSVVIEHPKAAIYNLMAEEVTFTLDQKGAQTKVTLTSSVYY